MDNSEWQIVFRRFKDFASTITSLHKVKVTAFSGRCNDRSMTIRIVLESTEPEFAAAKAMEEASYWRSACVGFQMKEEWLGQEFTAEDGTVYKVMGANPKARKNAIVVKRVNDGKGFVCAPDMVKKGFSPAKGEQNA